MSDDELGGLAGGSGVVALAAVFTATVGDGLPAALEAAVAADVRVNTIAVITVALPT